MTRNRSKPEEADGTPEGTPDKSKRPASVAPRSLRGRLVAGVLIIIPLVVTGLLIRFVYNGALEVGVWLVYWASRASHWAFKLEGEPKWIDPENAEWTEKTVAVVLTVLMLYLLGWLGTNVVGRRILDFFEGLVEQIPLVATIYSAIKRMVQSLSGADNKDGDQQVVLIDFPHENMKAIAFMTNIVTDRATKERMATVYVPTTPNPTSGYMLIVPMNKITQVDWTKEEALSMILSGGASARPDVVLHRPGGGQPIPPPPVPPGAATSPVGKV
ncbi:MAG: DUF502 domain-containing protein [Planctomycetota bacterium]